MFSFNKTSIDIGCFLIGGLPHPHLLLLLLLLAPDHAVHTKELLSVSLTKPGRNILTSWGACTLLLPLEDGVHGLVVAAQGRLPAGVLRGDEDHVEQVGEDHLPFYIISDRR